MYSQLISDFVERESLPDLYAEDAMNYFVPLADHIARRILESKVTLFVGVNGAQGTGKSTLTRLLVNLLKVREFNVANLSIDDFYLSKAERKQLAETQHPLLSTRGVPGTHDVSLLLSKFEELRKLESGQRCDLPRFNKATDDRCGSGDWQKISEPLDAVFLEGWFVGAPPQDAGDIATALNELETNEDSDCNWREFVNTQLAGQYQTAFDQLDVLIMLQAPSFDQVFEWRSLQEEKLRRISSLDAAGIMNDAQLVRFIQHYERLTRHCLDYLPAKADILYELDASHSIKRVAGLSE